MSISGAKGLILSRRHTDVVQITDRGPPRRRKFFVSVF